MSAFLKLRCETAYATGAVRTPLSLHEFAAKLRRLGMIAKVDGAAIRLTCRGSAWTLSGWQQQGMERVGWLQFATDGDLSALSLALARSGVRHRFEWSRPRDLLTDDVRCVTSFDYRWADHSLAPGDVKPIIDTYDEPVPGASTV